MPTVLLAEDEQVVRTMVTRLLERRGYCVWATPDGLTALSLFREHIGEVDVAVLDVRMPRLGGPEALSEMRILRPSLPAILMSGFAQPDNVLLASLLRDGVRFVPKPVRVAALADLILDLAGAPRP